MNEKIKTSTFEIKDSYNKESYNKVKSKIYYKGLTIEMPESLFFPKKEKESKKKETDLPK
jgi:hypothetical protein